MLCKCKCYLNVHDIGKKEGGAGYENELEEEVKLPSVDGVEMKAEYYVAKPLRAAQSGSEPEQLGLAPEPEPLHQLSHWSRAVSRPSRAVTTLAQNLVLNKSDLEELECIAGSMHISTFGKS